MPMDDVASWRTTLYPLGYFSALFFTLRFAVQWWASERSGRSVVPRNFWWIGLIGNGFLIVHGWVQLQLPVMLTQLLNAMIALRNLNLMRSDPTAHWKRGRFIIAVVASLLLALLLFAVQKWFFPTTFAWFQEPPNFWNHYASNQVTSFWQWLGVGGLLLFNARFWVQWWEAERLQATELSPLFWKLSLIGAITSLLYFCSTHDAVNALGPLFGVVIYARNLTLTSHQAASCESDERCKHK